MTVTIGWAMFCATVTEHGTRRIVANPVEITGESVRYPQFGWNTSREELADFEVLAYLGDGASRLWGWSYRFTPRDVDLSRAEACVRVLRQVQRGVDRIDRLIGPPADFPGFLARVALTLGIERYVVAGDDSIAFLNESGFTFHDEAGIREWIAGQERTHGAPV